MTRRKQEPGYENQSAAAKPKLEPVVCPKPVYGSATEKLMYEYAVETTPRKPGESLWDWLGRVVEAQKKQARQLELSVE